MIFAKVTNVNERQRTSAERRRNDRLTAALRELNI